MFALTIRGDVGPRAPAGQPLTWERIERAIRALDGETLTEVVVTGPDLAWAGVAGGGGVYSVDLTLDDRRWYHLVSPDAPDEPVEFVAAGQAVRKSRRRVADLAATLRALRAFAVEGRIAEELAWESR